MGKGSENNFYGITGSSTFDKKSDVQELNNILRSMDMDVKRYKELAGIEVLR